MRQISGLGNQMFQYAAGRYYAKRYGAQMRVATNLERKAHSQGHPRPFLLANFSTTAPFREVTSWERLLCSEYPLFEAVSAVPKRVLGAQVIRETKSQRYRFVPDLPVERNTQLAYLVGYWQVYPIADAIAGEIRMEFTLREPPQGKNLEVLDRINRCNSPVSLHIRRGDYTSDFEGNVALPIDYYSRAIQFFQERLNQPVFFVFSDDMVFARKNLREDIHAIFVDHNDSFAAHEDLRLMSSCRHHIIANSTLSWWSAWLNPSMEKVVVAPKRWRVAGLSTYPDLLPPEWNLIDDATAPA